jgi:hypothetical protein
MTAKKKIQDSISRGAKSCEPIIAQAAEMLFDEISSASKQIQLDLFLEDKELFEFVKLACEAQYYRASKGKKCLESVDSARKELKDIVDTWV